MKGTKTGLDFVNLGNEYKDYTIREFKIEVAYSKDDIVGLKEVLNEKTKENEDLKKELGETKTKFEEMRKQKENMGLAQKSFV